MLDSFYIRWRIGHPPDELWNELGALGCDEIQRYFKLLTGREISDGDYLYYRPSPSLILRGEAQLLGLSDPRFGFRILLCDNQTSPIAILNLRRIGRIIDQFRQLTTHKIPFYSAWRGPMPGRKLSTIADCLFSLPEKHSDRNQWCLTRLPEIVSRHYGEDWSKETLPFLRPLEFISGGLCAQACCWMADHYGYAAKSRHNIHSMPDITRLARASETKQVSLAGLSASELINYYNVRPESELRLSYQFIDSNALKEAVLFGDPNCQPVHRAIKSYIRSGFPTLLLVDANRMMGRGHMRLPATTNIYFQNGLMKDRPFASQLKKAHDAMHMIMVIGFNRTSNDVIFNDPGYGPFLKADLRLLFSAGCYLRPENTDEYSFGDHLQPPSFLSIVPKPVRLPLLAAYEDEELSRPLDGLFALSREVGWPTNDFHPIGYENKTQGREGTFLLTQISDIRAKSVELRIEKPEVAELLASLPKQLDSCNQNHWVWVEARGLTLLVWDAQKSPQDWDRPGTAEGFLIAYGAICKPGSVRWGFGKAHQSIVQPSSPYPLKPIAPVTEAPESQLLQACVTSYARNGLSKAKLNWGHFQTHLDIYCHQREESAEVLPHCSLRKHSWARWLWRSGVMLTLRKIRYSLPRRLVWDVNALHKLKFRARKRLPMVRPDINVCDWMAKKCDHPEYIQLAAQAINAHLPGGKNLCLAVSSFLPEFGSCNPKMSKKGIRAVRFIFRLVNTLNSEHGCAIGIIKLSAGNLIRHLHWKRILSEDVEARGKWENNFTAEHVSKQEAHEKLLEALAAVAGDIPLGVSIALELEPSPAAVISNYADLLEIHRMLDSHQSGFGRNIGFNCDIARFTLAGVSPRQLLLNPEGPIKRMVSFQLSDTGNGHFHDLIPGTARITEDIKDWNSVIKKVAAARAIQNQSLLVSLKLERTLGINSVKKGIAKMKWILT
jgi:hypothetical protein